MWDVIWTDPDKELVGEHRARKGSEEAREKKKKKKSNKSERASVSTASSRSSLEIPFSLFRGRGPKRINAAGSNGGMASSISSGLNSPSVASTRSPLSRNFEEVSRESSDRASASIFERHVDTSPDASPVSGNLVESTSGISRSTSNDVDSIFSTSAADTTTTSSLGDPIEDGSMTESEKMRSIIEMLEHSVPTLGQKNHQSRKAEGCGLKDDADALQIDTFFGGLSTPPKSPTRSIRQSLGLRLDPPASPAFLVPPLKSPRRMFAQKLHMPTMLNSPDAWKAPDQWNLAPQKSFDSVFEVLNQGADRSSSDSEVAVPFQVDSLRQEMSRMAATKPREQAPILHELWNKTSSRGPQSLASPSAETMELRRWMLSAMHHRDLSAPAEKKTVQESPTSWRMVLILHEASFVVRYLAALYQFKHLYDMSVGPRVYENFSNIRHIPVSSISADDFPVAPRIFESVHSLSLASSCPSDALKGTLQSVHRCLKPGGVLHLTLIDPLPRAGTMGPRMRAWIEENLLRTLARQGRCMSPSTLFPHLLGEAGLRGKGSTLTTTKFFAHPLSARPRQEEEPDADANSEMDRLRAESEVKAEVRSLVGRTLWVEVWGAHVTADKWWWEDEGCVRECLELGTFWEYHTIKGVKGDERKTPSM